MISAVIATRNRRRSLERTLRSLVEGSLPPDEVIIVDASDDLKGTGQLLALCGSVPLRHHPAQVRGAAAQRNQGVLLAKGNHILFVDDDIVASPDCLFHMKAAVDTGPQVGGACATITNQTYSPPGTFSSVLFRWLNREELDSYAGRCIGPAKTFHPAMGETLPAIVSVDWLPTTMVLYRREALPDPPFLERFVGASLTEDLTLSLLVGRTWQLVNAREAEVLHDSQPGDHKADEVAHAKMELLNRHFIMTDILQRALPSDYLRLFVCNVFEIVGAARTLKANPVKRLWGNLLAWIEILTVSPRS